MHLLLGLMWACFLLKWMLGMISVQLDVGCVQC